MKPQRIDLRGATRIEDVIDRVLQTRLGEVRALAPTLEQRETRGLHDFRIACKRLRYALERFGAFDPALERIAESLAHLQDALGEAHDRDVLLAILPPAMAATERRLKNEREQCVNEAVLIWQRTEQWMRALDSHRI